MLIKKEAESSLKYGCNPEQRPISEKLAYGIINIDKPKGPTSHQVSDFVKKILNLKKAGHSGTLDPGVTGVLPIGLEKATRVIGTVLKSNKEYIGIMHLHSKTTNEEIEKIAKEMSGKIQQLPPIKSAIKRQLRTRTVHNVEILEVKEQDVLFRISCEAGTYIRKWVHDFGEKIGTGAHMAELRRIRAGIFKEDNLITLQDLTDLYYEYKNNNNNEIEKYIYPVEKAVEQVKKIYVLDSTINSICHGANLNIPGISKLEKGIKKKDQIAIMTLKGELIALGQAVRSSESIMKENKGTAVKTNNVFMNKELYQKIESNKK